MPPVKRFQAVILLPGMNAIQMQGIDIGDVQLAFLAATHAYGSIGGEVSVITYNQDIADAIVAVMVHIKRNRETGDSRPYVVAFIGSPWDTDPTVTDGFFSTLEESRTFASLIPLGPAPDSLHAARWDHRYADFVKLTSIAGLIDPTSMFSDKFRAWLLNVH